MIVIPIVIGALGTISKILVKGLEDLVISGLVETIQTTALRPARILRRVLETRGNLLSQRIQWKTISKCLYEEFPGNDNNRKNYKYLWILDADTCCTAEISAKE